MVDENNLLPSMKSKIVWWEVMVFMERKQPNRQWQSLSKNWEGARQCRTQLRGGKLKIISYKVSNQSTHTLVLQKKSERRGEARPTLAKTKLDPPLLIAPHPPHMLPPICYLSHFEKVSGGKDRVGLFGFFRSNTKNKICFEPNGKNMSCFPGCVPRIKLFKTGSHLDVFQ